MILRTGGLWVVVGSEIIVARCPTVPETIRAVVRLAAVIRVDIDGLKPGLPAANQRHHSIFREAIGDRTGGSSFEAAVRAHLNAIQRGVPMPIDTANP